MKKVILLHGKDRTSNDIWYPWLLNELSKLGISCFVPDLPNADHPKIKEWLAVIDNLHPDAETIMVGHSRGGMAILRWLETNDIRIAKAVLVAANSATIEDIERGDFYSGPYDYKKIRSNCSDFVVMHSKDDIWVPYEAGLENARGLSARLITFNDKGHFVYKPDGSRLTVFPELLKELVD